MKKENIDLFISAMADKLPSNKIMAVRSQLEKIGDERFSGLQLIKYKNPTTMLIISLFLGYFGVDRFVLGDTGWGMFKLLLCGGLVYLTIIDWFTIKKMTREHNFQLFMQNAI